MKKLDTITFDFALCRKQVEEFRAWLASKDELSEKTEVLPFFRDRPHMAILFGMFNPRICWADRIGWEFDIFGDFACDLAVGERGRNAYCFVEFEDGMRGSVFEQEGKKATRKWGRRFDHGYSQVIDWFHKLDDRRSSADFVARFGSYEINYEAVLVIGRDQHLDAGEKQRLNWRNANVAVHTKKVYCMTYDELLSQLSTRLKVLSDVEKATLDVVKAASATKPTDPSSGNPASAPAKPSQQGS
jgi:hypothetical protein